MTEDYQEMLPDSEELSEVVFSNLEGVPPEPLDPISDKELGHWKDLTVHLEVIFGSASLSLARLASITRDTVIPLEQHEDELCDLLMNGQRIARGKIVSQKGHYGIQILSLTEKKVP